MRTTVTIKDDLFREAKRLSGAKTIKDTVEIALEEYVRKRRARKLMDWEGKVDLAFSLEELLRRRRDDVPH